MSFWEQKAPKKNVCIKSIENVWVYLCEEEWLNKWIGPKSEEKRAKRKKEQEKDGRDTTKDRWVMAKSWTSGRGRRRSKQIFLDPLWSEDEGEACLERGSFLS